MHLFWLFGGGETARARCYELVSVWTLHLYKLLLSDALCSESVRGEGYMQLTPLHTHAKYLHGDHVIKSMVQLFNSLALSFCAFICGCTHIRKRRSISVEGSQDIVTCEAAYLPNHQSSSQVWSLIFQQTLHGSQPVEEKQPRHVKFTRCVFNKFILKQHFPKNTPHTPLFCPNAVCWVSSTQALQT